MKKDKIEKAIDEGVLEFRKKHDSDRSYEKYHPSEIADCARKIFWKHLGMEGTPFEPRTLRIFDNGHKMHERMVEHLSESKIFNLIAAEFRVYDEKFSGQVDALGIIDRKPVILDFKSIGDYGFRLKKGGEVDKRYVWQAHVYMFLIGIKNFNLVYENKNDQRILIVNIPFEKKIIDEIYKKVASIESCITYDTLPDREFEETDWHCRYCSYQKMCWSDKEEKKEE